MRGHCEMGSGHHQAVYHQLENGCHRHHVRKHGHHRGFEHYRRFGHHHGSGHCHGLGHHHGFGQHKHSGHFAHHGKFNQQQHHKCKEHLLEMLRELLILEKPCETGHNTSLDHQEAATSAEKETTRFTKCSGSRHWGRKHGRIFHTRPSITTSRTPTHGDVQTETAVTNQTDLDLEHCHESPDMEIIENVEHK